ncbi:MAG: non-heme iron oxygenase ferredoxin subunit [Verrucomicrobiales bacterium]|nr:non-heme iron oxygenase ferredoxin subunit [Verrucomicrobiales bacterium]MCP5560161.1 non-heme iron oxygenase ferredoxin subunit [Verrucomicrobiaceae bacterium]
MALHRIAATTDIPSGEARAFGVAGRRIAVFNIGGKFQAIDDTCPHDGGPLSEGMMEDDCVTCPWHGATFELCTGKEQTSLAGEDVRSYDVVIEGEDLSVEIE